MNALSDLHERSSPPLFIYLLGVPHLLGLGNTQTYSDIYMFSNRVWGKYHQMFYSGSSSDHAAFPLTSIFIFFNVSRILGWQHSLMPKNTASQTFMLAIFTTRRILGQLIDLRALHMMLLNFQPSNKGKRERHKVVLEHRERNKGQYEKLEDKTANESVTKRGLTYVFILPTGI